MKFSTIFSSLLAATIVSAADAPDGATDRRAAPYQFVGNRNGNSLEWDLLIKDAKDAHLFKLTNTTVIEGFEITDIKTQPLLVVTQPTEDVPYGEVWFKSPNNASYDGDGSNTAQIFTVIAHTTKNQTEYNLGIHVEFADQQFDVNQSLGQNGY